MEDDNDENKKRRKQQKKKEKPGGTRFDTLAIPQKRNILGTYKDHAYHFLEDRAANIKQKLQKLFDMTPGEIENLSQQMNNKTRQQQYAREQPGGTRFDTLAIPQKRNIMGTYKDHAYHFPKDRAANIKHKLQTFFALTPEETENLYESMNNKTRQQQNEKEQQGGTRFDTLAIPQKRNMLGTYKDHAYHFPKDRANNIKQKLQKLFTLTPEETENLYEHINNETGQQQKGQEQQGGTRFDKLAIPQKRNMLATYKDHAYHFPKDRATKVKQKLQKLFSLTPEETEILYEQINNEKRQQQKEKGQSGGTRFDKLAIPQKRNMLATYKDHAYHFPKDRATKVKQKLQKLFSLTPEETEILYEQINNEKRQQQKGKEQPEGSRFDKLAIPQKRNILGTFKDHAYHFPKDRTTKIKHKLQKLFAMTPRETEKYLEQMRNEANEQEYRVRRHINKKTRQQQNIEEKPCRTRFDTLATPHKRNILGTYKDHAHHFPKAKAANIKHKLQELFAMTPEETEKYFEQMRKEANDIAKKKMMKVMLKRVYRKKQRGEQERKAYRLVEKLLKQGMMHSFKNPVPPLISVRLRNLSDIILEQICDLRNMDIPDRDNPDQCGSFLIAVADWMAIAIEHIYYAVQLKKNKELAEIENQVVAFEKEKLDKEQKKIDKEGKESGLDKKKEKPDEIQEDEYDELELDIE